MSFGLSSPFGLGHVDPDVTAAPFEPAKPKGRRVPVLHDGAGYGTILMALKFSAWACEQQNFPTVEQVQTRFNCCRATAYRWTNALAEVYGVELQRGDR